MADFPWAQWLVLTAATEIFLVWYIRRTKSSGTIQNRNWPFKSERLLDRNENPELFDRLVKGWAVLLLITPFVTFGVLYFGDY